MLGEACALGAALCWSWSVVLFKRSERISPQGMNLFKNAVALALLGVTLLVTGGRLDAQRSMADWARLIVSGALGLALADTLIFMALKRLGAGLLAIVDCTYAPVIVVMSVLFLDERVTVMLLVGAALVLGGVLAATVERAPSDAAATSQVGRDAAASSPTEPASSSRTPMRERATGIVLGALGIAAMGVGVVLAKPVLETSSLVEVTFVRLAAGVGGQLAWMAVVPSQRVALEALRPQPAWRTLAPAAVLGTYVSMLLWLGGFKWASASRAAVLNQMASVFTLVLARIYLGEALTRRRALGAALAVAGAIAIVASR